MNSLNVEFIHIHLICTAFYDLLLLLRSSHCHLHVVKAMYYMEFNESTSDGGFKVSPIPVYFRKVSDWVKGTAHLKQHSY